MKQLFILLILLSNLVSAFSFDVWDSKITLKEAIQIAQKNNIPLHKDGVFSGKKGFYAPNLYLKKYPNNRLFRYHTKLLNENASVFLYFTKKSKKLYKIKIRWGKSDKAFLSTIYEIMDKKYGKRKISMPQNVGDYIFNTSRQWQPDKETIIQIKKSIGLITLFYYDIEETHNEEQEQKEIKLEKKKRALIKDANKF